MDALAVSISSGLVIPDVNASHGIKIGLFFGLFQAIMPILGWLAGSTFRVYISSIDHWIAFILLGLVGAKMIYEALTDHKSEETVDPSRLKVLLVLSVATSIDALAVGLSFAMLSVPLFPAVLIIGVTTFLLSSAGVYLGKRCSKWAGKFVEIAGGIILFAIGLKILIEHLSM
jgi:putative Mn2+ efflux pump MntP